MKDKKSMALIYMIIFIGVFILFLKFPTTGDDWNRMAGEPLTYNSITAMIIKQYNNLNGRILGNIFSFIFIKPLWLRTLYKSLSFITLLWAMMRFTKIKSFIWIALGFIIMITVPVSIFREDWVWSAGFFNYIPPLTIIMLLLCFITETIQQKKLDNKIITPLMIIIALMGGLFMENLSLSLCFITALGFVFYLIKYKRLSISLLLIFIGSCISAAIMFLSPVYQRVATSQDKYRTIGVEGSRIKTVMTNWDIFSSLLLRGAILFLVIVFISSTLILWQNKNKFKGNILLYISYGLMVVLTGYFLIYNSIKVPFKLDFPLTIAYYINLIILGVMIIGNKELSLNWIYILLTLGSAIVPLLIVTPIGARNFYTTQYLQGILSLILISQVKIEQRQLFTMTVGLAIIGIVVYGSYYHIYSVIDKVNNQRISLVEEAIKFRKTMVQIPKFPYPWAVHDQDGEKMNNYYYIEQPGDVEITTKGSR